MGYYDPPDPPIYEPSLLVDGILTLLEEAGVPTTINDEIVRLVEEWEAKCFAEQEALLIEAQMEALSTQKENTHD